jgi:hypothetical protein
MSLAPGARETAAEEGPAIPTMQLLRDLGFVDDQTGLIPGLSFDFGNFKLSAISGVNRHFTDVVMLFGVMVTDRSISEVACEMPHKVESVEQGKAWVTWCLDNSAGGKFKPATAPAWLAEGRQYFHLLPWKRMTAAYDARPHCAVDRDWARLALKSLGQHLATVDDGSQVIFAFDGNVLTIACDGKTFPMPAQGPGRSSTQFPRAR